MNRREILISAGAVALAGCTADSPDEGDDLEFEDVIGFIDHDFRTGNPGIRLDVTVKNRSDEELRSIRILSDIYEDNRRIYDLGTYVDNLGPGIQDSGTLNALGFERHEMDNVTHYTITIRTFLDSIAEEFKETWEFDDFDDFQDLFE